MRRGLRSKEDELIRQRYAEFKRKQRGEEHGSGSGSASASGVCGQSSGRRSSAPENNHSDGSENDGGGDSSDGIVEFVGEENVGSETVENQATSSDDDVVFLWSSRISDGGGVAEDVGTRGSKTGGHDDSGEKNDESETVQGGKPSEEASSGDDKEAVLSSSETSDGDAEDLDYEVDLPSDAPEDLSSLRSKLRNRVRARKTKLKLVGLQENERAILERIGGGKKFQKLKKNQLSLDLRIIHFR